MTVEATRPPAARIGLVESTTNQSQQNFPATTSATGSSCDGSPHTALASPSLACRSRRAPSPIPAPRRPPDTPFDPETAATVALVGAGTRPVNSRSFHVHKTLPVDPMVLPGVCARTTLGEDSHRTGSVSADTLPLDHDRKEEAPERSLNLEPVSATSVISLLCIKQGDNPFAALESSSVRGFFCFPSANSTTIHGIPIMKGAASEYRQT